MGGSSYSELIQAVSNDGSKPAAAAAAGRQQQRARSRSRRRRALAVAGAFVTARRRLGGRRPCLRFLCVDRMLPQIG